MDPLGSCWGQGPFAFCSSSFFLAVHRLLCPRIRCRALPILAVLLARPFFQHACRAYLIGRRPAALQYRTAAPSLYSSAILSCACWLDSTNRQDSAATPRGSPKRASHFLFSWTFSPRALCFDVPKRFVPRHTAVAAALARIRRLAKGSAAGSTSGKIELPWRR